MFLFIGLRTQYVRSLGHLFDALPTLLDTLESKARIINIILNEINKTEQSYDQFQDIAPSMFRIDQHYCEMKFL